MKVLNQIFKQIVPVFQLFNKLFFLLKKYDRQILQEPTDYFITAIHFKKLFLHLGEIQIFFKKAYEQNFQRIVHNLTKKYVNEFEENIDIG